MNKEKSDKRQRYKCLPNDIVNKKMSQVIFLALLIPFSSKILLLLSIQ
jgi:hypothetical protein